jgi:hypothetical protein
MPVGPILRTLEHVYERSRRAFQPWPGPIRMLNSAIGFASGISTRWLLRAPMTSATVRTHATTLQCMARFGLSIPLQSVDRMDGAPNA